MGVWTYEQSPQIAKFMGSTWGPPGSSRPQVSPMLAPWTFLSGTMRPSFTMTLPVVLTPSWAESSGHLYKPLTKSQQSLCGATTLIYQEFAVGNNHMRPTYTAQHVGWYAFPGYLLGYAVPSWQEVIYRRRVFQGLAWKMISSRLTVLPGQLIPLYSALTKRFWLNKH